MKIRGVSQLCGVNAETVRQWAEKGWLVPAHVTVEGTWLYYTEDVEEFARRREGYAGAAPRLKAAYGLGPDRQIELEVPVSVSKPFEGWVE